MTIARIFAVHSDISLSEEHFSLFLLNLQSFFILKTQSSTHLPTARLSTNISLDFRLIYPTIFTTRIPAQGRLKNYFTFCLQNVRLLGLLQTDYVKLFLNDPKRRDYEL